jgi:hypothetical protein
MIWDVLGLLVCALAWAFFFVSVRLRRDLEKTESRLADCLYIANALFQGGRKFARERDSLRRTVAMLKDRESGNWGKYLAREREIRERMKAE